MMKKLAALNKHPRPPQTREVEASRRAARSRTDNDDIPQVTFSVRRSDFPGGSLHGVWSVPLKARPAFSYIASRTRAVNTASSGGSASDSSPPILFTNASSWSWYVDFLGSDSCVTLPFFSYTRPFRSHLIHPFSQVTSTPPRGM